MSLVAWLLSDNHPRYQVLTFCSESNSPLQKKFQLDGGAADTQYVFHETPSYHNLSATFNKLRKDVFNSVPCSLNSHWRREVSVSPGNLPDPLTA